MFTQIQFCEIKQHIGEEKNVDVSRTLDQFDSNTSSLDQIERLIAENSMLQLVVANSYYYLKNCSIDIVGVLTNQDVDKAMLPLFFKKILVNYNEHDDIVSFQIEGITQLCKDAFERLICNGSINQMVTTLFYDGNISDDVQKTSCYHYQLPNETEYCAFQDHSFIDLLFENDFFKKFGALNLSSLRMQELNNCSLINYMQTKASNLYLYVYDLTFNGQTHFAKYLHWY